LRDVGDVYELLRVGDWRHPTFRTYVADRLERMRRVRVTAQLAARLRVEFGDEAAARRARAFKRILVDKVLNPYMAIFGGPESVPTKAFDEGTIEALLVP